MKIAVVSAVLSSLIASTALAQEMAPGFDANAAAPAAFDQSAAEPAAPPPVEEVAVQATPSTPAETPTLQRFEEALSPYGQWVNTPAYGRIWIPANMPAGWRPYTNGRWAYTDAGWTFVSSDTWGWAPFHYGRWIYYGSYGWSWIPGYQWSPAWVSWRYGGGHIAWAPLGPDGVSLSYYDAPSLWLAVQGPYFYRPLAYSYFIPSVRVPFILRSTTFVGIPRVGRYLSPPVAYVSRLVGQPVVRLSVRQVAPYFAARGAYRPSVFIDRAFRTAPVVARPSMYRGNPFTPARPVRTIVSPRVQVNVPVRPIVTRPYVAPRPVPPRPLPTVTRPAVRPHATAPVSPYRMHVNPSSQPTQRPSWTAPATHPMTRNVPRRA